MFKQKGPGVSKALTPMISRILPGSELAVCVLNDYFFHLFPYITFLLCS